VKHLIAPWGAAGCRASDLGMLSSHSVAQKSGTCERRANSNQAKEFSKEYGVSGSKESGRSSLINLPTAAKPITKYICSSKVNFLYLAIEVHFNTDVRLQG